MRALTLRSTALSRPAAAFVALFALAGCAADSVTTRYDATHPIAVDTAPQMLEIEVAKTLDPVNALKVDAFAKRFLVTARTPLTIAYPQEQAKASRALVHATVHRLKDAGVSAKRIMRGAYSTEADGDRGVVLSYRGDAAFAAECPTYLGDSTRDVSNATPRYFGCAVRQNLATMVDRPSDLIEPRALTPVDAQRRQLVIESYRAGQSTSAAGSERQIETTQ